MYQIQYGLKCVKSFFSVFVREVERWTDATGSQYQYLMSLLNCYHNSTSCQRKFYLWFAHLSKQSCLYCLCCFRLNSGVKFTTIYVKSLNDFPFFQAIYLKIYHSFVLTLSSFCVPIHLPVLQYKFGWVSNLHPKDAHSGQLTGKWCFYFSFHLILRSSIIFLDCSLSFVGCCYDINLHYFLALMKFNMRLPIL